MVVLTLVSFKEEGRECFCGHSPPQHTKHSVAPLPDILHSSQPPDFGIRGLNGLLMEQKLAEKKTKVNAPFHISSFLFSYLQLDGYFRYHWLFFSSFILFLSHEIEMLNSKIINHHCPF